MKKVKRNRSSRALVYICSFVLILGASQSLHAQQEKLDNDRVAVMPLWFGSDVQSGQAVSSAVQTTIQFFLRFLPNYDLIEAAEYPSGQSGLLDFMKDNNLDSVIYGRINQRGFEIEISLLLYDRAEDQVVAMQQGTASGALQLFDLADELSLQILESFLGRPLVFGTLLFEPEEDFGDYEYTVYINDLLAGDFISRLERFLAGEYTLRIEHTAPDGHTIYLFNDQIELGENQSLRIPLRRYLYADVQLQLKGPQVPLVLRAESEDGRQLEQELAPGALLYVPAGSWIVTPYQIGYDGFLFPLEAFVIESEPEALYKQQIRTVALGRGFAFHQQSEQEQENAFFVDGQPVEGNHVDVLPLGRHLVQVYSRIEGELRLVYEQKVQTAADEQTDIIFPVFSSNADWQKWDVARRHLLAAEMVLLDGALFQAGLRYEFADRFLGVSITGGLYGHEGSMRFVAKSRFNWLPLGSAWLGPQLGLLTRIDTLGGEPQFSLGPQLGLVWNTNIGFLRAVFADMEIRYVPACDPFLLRVYYSIGLRIGAPGGM